MKLLFLLLTLALPAAARDCSRCIMVYGDTRKDDAVHAKLISLMRAQKPEAVFHTGDMVADGSKEKQWKKFRAITRDLRREAKFYPARGNHEGNAPFFFEEFGLKDWKAWYSTDLHGVHFVVLDSEAPFWKGTYQYKWLAGDLEAAAAAGTTDLTVVLLHRPPFSSSEHGSYDAPVVAETLGPLFERYGVDAVFSGHDHNYERLEKDGITYIVTGGGGAPLYPLVKALPHSRVYEKKYHYVALSRAGGALKAEVFDDAGALIDGFTVSGVPPRPRD